MSILLDKLRQRHDAPRLSHVWGRTMAEERLTATIQGYFGTGQLLVTLSNGERGVIDAGGLFRLKKVLMRFLEAHEPKDIIGGVLVANQALGRPYTEWTFNPATQGRNAMKK